MAQIPDKVIDIVHAFVNEARKDNINIIKAIIFGSYANGNYTKDSDIDLALVSDDFTGSYFYDSKKLFKSVRNISFDIETHPFRPEDFDENNPFINEIIKTGIEVSIN